MFESLMFNIVAVFVYVALSFWVGSIAYDKTKRASAITGWGAVSMMITPVLGWVLMSVMVGADLHMTAKQNEANQRIEPAV
ncbi:hypothetical protein [Aeromonas salmonicida]|uniref:hypothetical protein n=1 Tax=Aeromonas salmonicida TaxID=645 RepID=UPI003D312274